MNLNRILDSTDSAVLRTLRLETEDRVHDDYQITNGIGEAAHEQGFQAILARSATGVDNVLAVFTENLGKSILRPDLIELWESPDDLAL